MKRFALWLAVLLSSPAISVPADCGRWFADQKRRIARENLEGDLDDVQRELQILSNTIEELEEDGAEDDETFPLYQRKIALEEEEMDLEADLKAISRTPRS